MKADVSADEARRHSDETVRRLREESGRRTARDAQWRAFTSGCALASLVGGISLAALNAHDVRSAEQEARWALAAHDATIADACAARAASFVTIERLMRDQLARAMTDAEREVIRAEASARRIGAINAAADSGCGQRVVSGPAPRSERSAHRPPPPGEECAGPCYERDDLVDAQLATFEQ